MNTNTHGSEGVKKFFHAKSLLDSGKETSKRQAIKRAKTSPATYYKYEDMLNKGLLKMETAPTKLAVPVEVKQDEVDTEMRSLIEKNQSLLLRNEVLTKENQRLSQEVKRLESFLITGIVKGSITAQ